MNPFLNEVLDLINKKDSLYMEEIAVRFDNSMKNAHHLFGKYAFRKCLPDDLHPAAKKPYINKSMFIVWSIALAEFNPDDICKKVEFESFAKIVANEMVDKEDFDEFEYAVPNDYHWLFTAGTSDKKNLSKASTITNHIIEDFLVPLL